MQSSKSPAAGQVFRALRLSVPFGLATCCLWLLSTRVDLPSGSELGSMISALQFWQWGAACLATALSFWALGRYDCVAHRHLQTGLDGPAARRAGMAAIAFSQFVGFGLFSGAYARWRLIPALSAMQAAQLTGLVGLTFMAALAVISGSAMVLFPPSPWYQLIGAVILICTLATAAYSFWAPAMTLGSLKLHWPSLTAMAALSGWALIDVAAAGTALWVLLPQSLDITWSTLLVVYFIALGAAIVSSAPGGTGPLELTIFSLLPGHDSAALIAALLAFRLVYYVLPASLACLALVAPSMLQLFAQKKKTPDLMGSHRRSAAALPQDRTCAETGIIRQNGGHVQAFGLNQLAMLDTPQISLAFFDPLSGHASEIFAPFKTYAQHRNTTACLYKCSPRIAQQARRAKWAVVRIASEAVIDPTQFSESGSCRRQLRRKLRHAEKSGLIIRPAPATLPISQMAAIDTLWQESHGIAHGTTMGRFEAQYLASQKVMIAWQEQRIIGFISLHSSTQEWCLDLIRLAPNAPDGTGHALIRAAIDAANKEGVSRLSLAAVPDHHFAKWLNPGLRRFKSSFAPNWQPRYVASPSWAGLALSLVEILRLVHRPGPVQPAACQTKTTTEPMCNETREDRNWFSDPTSDNRHPHNEVEDYAIALKR